MWIEDYRREHNLELDEFARLVNAVGREIHSPWYGTVTDELVYTLETRKNAKTHPHFADAIAVVCKATPEQRDSIVAEKHRGWEPPKKNFSWSSRPTVIKPDRNAFAVVMISPAAKILKRYKNVRIAAMYGEMGEDAIKKRCQHKVEHEFTPDRPYTYRYAKDWDCLSREAKIKDIGVDMYEQPEQ